MSGRYYRTTRARSTGTDVTTGHADDLGLDRGVSTYDGTETTRWYNVCEHGSAVGHTSLALARSFAAAPEEWCEECRAVTTCWCGRPARDGWTTCTKHYSSGRAR